jgi:hypothetical protein
LGWTSISNSIDNEDRLWIWMKKGSCPSSISSVWWVDLSPN